MPRRGDPVAIVGIGCRFPGVRCPDEFWSAVAGGVDGVTEVSPERFNVETYVEPSPGTRWRISSPYGGQIARFDSFDYQFFGISRNEAELMDPQQRLMLEVSWEALEDAGVVPGPANREVGVFVGVSNDDQRKLLPYLTSDLTATALVGSSRNAIASRIAYTWDFVGPAFAVDADATSALLAVDLALQSLASDECRLAVVGAVNLVLGPDASIAWSRARLLAGDGWCKFADETADGIVRSDGVGTLILKRLADARRDGDRVYATIAGCAVEHVAERPPVVAPPATAFQAVIERACATAAVSPSDIDLFEAHGSGIAAADRAELHALSALCSGDDARTHYVGSVKSNFGHCEGAAAMAGLIKVALALYHHQIPPTIHLQRPVATLPPSLIIPRTAQGWPEHQGPALAGVTAAGLDGSVGHVVLSSPPRAEQPGHAAAEHVPGRPMLVPFSAGSSANLPAVLTRFAEWLDQPSQQSLPLEDIVYSCTRRRAHHQARLGLVVGSTAALRNKIRSVLEAPPQSSDRHGEPSKIAFLFPGMGSQWLHMGRDLLHEPVFAQTIDRCDEVARAHFDWSVRSVLNNSSSDWLQRTDVVQPSVMSVEIALAELWRHWGVLPQAVLGISLGEVCAAYAAGVLSLEDTMRVTCVRAKLLQQGVEQGTIEKGGMIVVGLSVAQAEERLARHLTRVTVGIHNGPEECVLAGSRLDLEQIAQQLDSDGIFLRWVRMGYAAHHASMEPILGELRRRLEGLSPRAAKVPYFSSTTGQVLSGFELGSPYWPTNLRSPVLLAECIGALLQQGFNTFLEVSPHPVAETPVLEVARHQRVPVSVIGSLRRDEDGWVSLLTAAASLFRAGHTMQWEKLGPAHGSLVSLPTYPWAGTTLRPEAPWSRVQPWQPTSLSGRKRGELRMRILAADDDHERSRLISAFLADEAAEILGAQPADGRRTILALGFHPLMADELSCRLRDHLGVTLSGAQLIELSISQIADRVLAQVKTGRAAELRV